MDRTRTRGGRAGGWRWWRSGPGQATLALIEGPGEGGAGPSEGGEGAAPFTSIASGGGGGGGGEYGGGGGGGGEGGGGGGGRSLPCLPESGRERA